VKETVTVLARAIPEASHKYGRLVCVAGINENNEWRRLYPYPLAKVGFRKRDKIQVECGENPQDARPESRRVEGPTQVSGRADAAEVTARLAPLATSIGRMDASHATLGVVKPQLLGIKVTVNSTNLMDEQTYLNALAENGLTVKEKVKLPVQVSYVFQCSAGACSCAKKPHDITVIDWEVNELARNVMKTTSDKTVVEAKMRAKLFDWMKTRDLHFVMGTHFKWGTWMIVGFFYPSPQKKGLTGVKPFSFGPGNERLSLEVDEVLNED